MQVSTRAPAGECRSKDNGQIQRPHPHWGCRSGHQPIPDSVCAARRSPGRRPAPAADRLAFVVAGRRFGRRPDQAPHQLGDRVLRDPPTKRLQIGVICRRAEMAFLHGEQVPDLRRQRLRQARRSDPSHLPILVEACRGRDAQHATRDRVRGAISALRAAMNPARLTAPMTSSRPRCGRA
jgi:hypothetical protein